MLKYKRIFTIVVDSLGVGAMEDSEAYGDQGADTLGSIAKAKYLQIPNLSRLGIGNLHPVQGLEAVENPVGKFCKLKELSCGKDTLTGHYEMMGLKVEMPFQTFTETGFPKELIQELERRCNKRIIGNKSASGTEILEELAQEELESGAMIVYTSADSVLQICGHETYFDLSYLYQCCEIARDLCMKDEWKVARIIARPYLGEKKGEFVRTANRKDYALEPFANTILDYMKEQGFEVIGIGKINDIFCGRGITTALKSKSSVHGMEQTIAMLEREFTGLCYTNLVDFDALWGHRRNPLGYARELESFDVLLGEFMGAMREDDLLIVTADHGTDPSHHGTDHTREKVPFLAYSPNFMKGGALPNGESFANVGCTIAENFEITSPSIGRSYLGLL